MTLLTLSFLTPVDDCRHSTEVLLNLAHFLLIFECVRYMSRIIECTIKPCNSNNSPIVPGMKLHVSYPLYSDLLTQVN